MPSALRRRASSGPTPLRSRSERGAELAWRGICEPYAAPRRDSARLAREGESEATPRFELGNRAFAELRLTTWLRRRFPVSGWRESNPRVNLGKVAGYHYITPALTSPFGSPRRRSLPLNESAHAMLRLPALSLALGLLLTAPLVARAAVTARIDPAHSSAEFSVRHLVISNVRGTVPVREGSVVTDGTSTMPTSLSATLDATHLTTQNDD